MPVFEIDFYQAMIEPDRILEHEFQHQPEEGSPFQIVEVVSDLVPSPRCSGCWLVHVVLESPTGRVRGRSLDESTGVVSVWGDAIPVDPFPVPEVGLMLGLLVGGLVLAVLGKWKHQRRRRTRRTQLAEEGWQPLGGTSLVWRGLRWR